MINLKLCASMLFLIQDNNFSCVDFSILVNTSSALLTHQPTRQEVFRSVQFTLRLMFYHINLLDITCVVQYLSVLFG